MLPAGCNPSQLGPACSKGCSTRRLVDEMPMQGNNSVANDAGFLHDNRRAALPLRRLNPTHRVILSLFGHFRGGGVRRPQWTGSWWVLDRGGAWLVRIEAYRGGEVSVGSSGMESRSSCLRKNPKVPLGPIAPVLV
jgi:hypothetical protein